MGLDKVKMAADVVAAMKLLNTRITGQAETDLTAQWQAICGAIINRIQLDAAVTVATGIPVSVTGTAAAQTGNTTASGTGTIA